MKINRKNLPGAGFLLLLLMSLAIALLFSWAFNVTRMEKTIVLEDQGMQQLYRHNYAKALEYFEESARFDTDKPNHILRYLDSLNLALQMNDLDKARFFFNEVSGESPELLSMKEIHGLLDLQPDSFNAAAFTYRLSLVDSIDRQALNQAISKYIVSLDEHNKQAFLKELNLTTNPSVEQMSQ